MTADEGFFVHKSNKHHYRTWEAVHWCLAMLFWCSFIILKSQDHLVVSSITVYKGKFSNKVKLTFMFLLPPLAASANVAAEKMVKRASTWVNVINVIDPKVIVFLSWTKYQKNLILIIMIRHIRHPVFCLLSSSPFSSVLSWLCFGMHFLASIFWHLSSSPFSKCAVMMSLSWLCYTAHFVGFLSSSPRCFAVCIDLSRGTLTSTSSCDDNDDNKIRSVWMCSISNIYSMGLGCWSKYRTDFFDFGIMINIFKFSCALFLGSLLQKDITTMTAYF